MKKSILLFAAILGSYFNVLSAGDLHHSFDRNEKRFVDDSKTLKDEAYQQQLRSTPAWEQFTAANGSWWVEFNESNQKPHRAFGTPIPVNVSGTPAAVASYFLQSKVGSYLPGNVVLEFVSENESEKYKNVNFVQKYNGLEVLWSRATVRMNNLNEVVLFGLDVYDDIQVPVQAVLSPSQAGIAAAADLQYPASSIKTEAALKILPVPGYRKYSYHLVYEVEVRTAQHEGTPEAYYTLIDAMNGEVLYRKNKIVSMFNSDIQVSGTVYPTHPYNPSAVVNLPYLQVTVGGVNYNTDNNGFLNFPNSSSYNATFTLKGPWAQVYTGANGNTLQTFTATMNPGVNNVNFDPNSTDRHLTAYYHTNVVHDFMKNYLTGFTGLDLPLNVRVERTDGTCNAFYDGGLNFYTTAGGCYALSLVADVIYHEYGHGITNVFWSDNGLSFSNGAMGEGYSDIWAICITNNPVLGIGFSDTDPTSNVRNYDFANGIQKKVYPQNIVGEVHADGEIIAGAWWSTSQYLGSLSVMTDLFTESHFGLANGPDGAEGQVYTDILIDALLADDNDGNLSNGTPNIAAITQGFADHGITLLTNANLNHTPVTTAAAGSSITLNASLSNLQFAWALAGVKGAYKINNSGTWTNFSMTNTGSNNYTTTIPGQPAGTIISYYIGLEDGNGILTNVQPAGANAANPNIPYYIMVDFNKIFTEDFDITAGSWQEGLASDGATTGIWEQNLPEQTDISGTPVQPNFQVTPGGMVCYVTGGAAGAAAGANDVDGGATTLTSPVFDLSSYSNPTFEYYRWYSNDQGATPGTDFWQVSVSNDGVNYIPVENTNVADHSWRRFVFRVSDYITPSSTFTVRFVAEDAGAGSLIEALMDEFSLYDQATTSGISEELSFTQLSAWPNPAAQNLHFSCIQQQAADAMLQVSDQLGRQVYSSAIRLNAGKNQLQVPVGALSNGIYHLRLVSGKKSGQLKFTVLH